MYITKKLSGLGMECIEESILILLTDQKTKPNPYIKTSEISKRVGLYSGLEGTPAEKGYFIARGILDKLFEDGKVVIEYTNAGVRTGWKISESEYEKRCKD